MSAITSRAANAALRERSRRVVRAAARCSAPRVRRLAVRNSCSSGASWVALPETVNARLSGWWTPGGQ
ncbi:hypothetical protein ACWC09_39940 [Streptomyces sp. NPDC001617]